MGSPYVLLAFAVLCVSCGSILVRLAEAPSLAVAFYRVGLASLFLAPFSLRPAGRAWATLTPRQRLLLLGCGVTLAVHFATWIASLSYTSIASSVLLVNTAPLFAAGFAHAFLGETVSVRELLAILVALGGAGLIAAGDWRGAPGSLGGNLLALAGAVTQALYYVIGRALRGALPLRAYVFGVWSTAAVALAAVAFASGVSLAGYGPRAWGAFFALALVPTLAGHGLVNRALRSLPAPTVGLFGLGEPVSATILAFLVFGERPGPWTLAGGAVILAALVLVLAGKR